MVLRFFLLYYISLFFLIVAALLIVIFYGSGIVRGWDDKVLAWLNKSPKDP